MTEAIWATWYDLPEPARAEHLSWLHEHHIPSLLRRPGLAWAAHYENTYTVHSPGSPHVGRRLWPVVVD